MPLRSRHSKQQMRMNSVNLVYSEETITKAKKRRVVHEEIEETQTINFFDSYPTQNLEQNIKDADEMLENDLCLVPAEKITLREYDDINIGDESMFGENVSFLFAKCDI